MRKKRRRRPVERDASDFRRGGGGDEREPRGGQRAPAQVLSDRVRARVTLLQRHRDGVERVDHRRRLGAHRAGQRGEPSQADDVARRSLRAATPRLAFHERALRRHREDGAVHATPRPAPPRGSGGRSRRRTRRCARARGGRGARAPAPRPRGWAGASPCVRGDERRAVESARRRLCLCVCREIDDEGGKRVASEPGA